jgi:hypothetical protein
MRKMDELQMNEQFSAEVAPGMVLLDVAGRKNNLFNAERASAALMLADDLQDIGGSGKMTDYLRRDEIVDNIFTDKDDADEPEDQILVFYKPHSGRPKKSEIARAARIIARSEVREKDYIDDSDDGGKSDLFVTGTRALVYSETAPRDARHAAFLVSTTVWYNQNRSVEFWPFHEDQVQLFLDDINGRLTEGSVSIAR